MSEREIIIKYSIYTLSFVCLYIFCLLLSIVFLSSQPNWTQKFCKNYFKTISSNISSEAQTLGCSHWTHNPNNIPYNFIILLQSPKHALWTSANTYTDLHHLAAELLALECYNLLLLLEGCYTLLIFFLVGAGTSFVTHCSSGHSEA